MPSSGFLKSLPKKSYVLKSIQNLSGKSPVLDKNHKSRTPNPSFFVTPYFPEKPDRFPHR